MQIIILGKTMEEAIEKFKKLMLCYSEKYIDNIIVSYSFAKAVLTDGTTIRALCFGDNCRGYRADYLYISNEIPYDIKKKIIAYLAKNKDSSYEFF